MHQPAILATLDRKVSWAARPCIEIKKCMVEPPMKLQKSRRSIRFVCHRCLSMSDPRQPPSAVLSEWLRQIKQDHVSIFSRPNLQ
jgi:hypothetical protein